MPWSGTGTFSLLEDFRQDAAAGSPDNQISSEKVMTELENIKEGLENCLTRTGETTPTANIPMSGKRITGLAAATSENDAVRLKQVTGGVLNFAGTFGGTASAWATTLSTAPAGPTAGYRLRGIVASNNAGAVTVALNALAAKSIKRRDGSDLQANDFKAGQYVELEYNGAEYRIVSALEDGAELGHYRLSSVAGANTITASTSNGDLSALEAGMRFSFTPAATNTGAVTLNINSIGAKPVVDNMNSPLLAASLDTSAIYDVEYDGTSFRLMNNGPEVSNTLSGLSDVNTSGAADGQALAFDGSSGQWLPTSLTVGDDTVSTAKLQNDAVTADKLADDAVDTAAIADDAVTAGKIAADAVGANQIAANSIGDAEIGTVNASAIMNNASNAAGASVADALDALDALADGNASDIATNTSAIASNTAAISSNTTAISGKVAKSGDTVSGLLTSLFADNTSAAAEHLRLGRGDGSGAKLQLSTEGDASNGVARAVFTINGNDAAHIEASGAVEFKQGVTLEAGATVGKDTGGDAAIDFYDDTNDTPRTLKWDDGNSQFEAEEDDGTSYKLLTLGDAASQAEAEAGTTTNKFMTPQRTQQAIAKLSGRRVTGLPSFKSGSSGHSTNYVVVNGNEVWANGDGTLMANGHPGASDTEAFRKIPFSHPHGDIVQIHPTGRGCIALDDGGNVFGIGQNDDGELGQGDTTDRYIFTRIEYFVTNSKTISQIFVSNQSYTNFDCSVAAIDDDGQLYLWGSNTDGQLGDGTTTNVLTPAPASGFTSTKTVAIGSTYQTTTLVIRNDGTLWATGRNNDGQCGDGTTTDITTFKQITSMGSDNDKCYTQNSYNGGSSGNSFVIKTDGTLWATGYNSRGNLGLGDTTGRNAFTKVGTDTDWIDIANAAGGDATVWALKSNGKINTWGYNNFGAVGDGTTTQRNNPYEPTGDFQTKVTKIAACGADSPTNFLLTSDGEVYASGYNSRGARGAGTVTNDASIDKCMGLAEVTIADLSVIGYEGYGRALLLDDNGRLYSCGAVTSACLGLLSVSNLDSFLAFPDFG